MPLDNTRVSGFFRFLSFLLEATDAFEDFFLIGSLRRLLRRRKGKGNQKVRSDASSDLIRIIQQQNTPSLMWFRNLSPSKREIIRHMSKEEMEELFSQPISRRDSILDALTAEDNRLANEISEIWRRSEPNVRYAILLLQRVAYAAIAAPIAAIILAYFRFSLLSYFTMAAGAVFSLPFGAAVIGGVDGYNLILALTPGATVEEARRATYRVAKSYASFIALEFVLGFMIVIFEPQLTVARLAFFLFAITILAVTSFIVNKEAAFWEWVWYTDIALLAGFFLYLAFGALHFSYTLPEAGKTAWSYGWEYGGPVLTAFVISVVAEVMRRRRIFSRRAFALVAVLLWFRAGLNFIPVRYQVRLVGMDWHPMLLLDGEDTAWQVELAQGKYKSEACQKEAQKLEIEIEKLNPSYEGLPSEEENFRNEMREFKRRCSPFDEDTPLIERPFVWIGEKISNLATPSHPPVPITRVDM